MVVIVDNVAMVSMVDTNDTVYMLEKMDKKGPRPNCPHLVRICPNWIQLDSIVHFLQATLSEISSQSNKKRNIVYLIIYMLKYFLPMRHHNEVTLK